MMPPTTRSLAEAAAGAHDSALALAYLQAADPVIQVDDFPFRDIRPGPSKHGESTEN